LDDGEPFKNFWKFTLKSSSTLKLEDSKWEPLIN